MEKEGTQIAPIAHSDDKRQLTAVLAITASGDYLSPQRERHPSAIHRFHFHQVGMCGTQRTIWSSEITMKRYIDKIIIPFVAQKRIQLKLVPTHPAAAIFDNFCS